MDLEPVRRRLEAKAYLFDDPRAYVAGVNDALDAVARMQAWEELRIGAEDQARAVQDRIRPVGA